MQFFTIYTQKQIRRHILKTADSNGRRELVFNNFIVDALLKTPLLFPLTSAPPA